MLLRTTAVATLRLRAARLGAAGMQRRNWSFWEWAAKYDRPYMVPLAWSLPPRDMGWKPIDKINLREIEEGWEKMDEGQKFVIAKFLLQKQKDDWNKMTWDEKKAAWWIEFGEHSVRKPTQPGHGWRVFGGSMIGLAAGVGFFAAVRQLAEPYHPGLTREWQEATNEQLRRHYADPITGITSEGYKGKGAVFL